MCARNRVEYVNIILQFVYALKSTKTFWWLFFCLYKKHQINTEALFYSAGNALYLFNMSRCNHHLFFYYIVASPFNCAFGALEPKSITIASVQKRLSAASPLSCAKQPRFICKQLIMHTRRALTTESDNVIKDRRGGINSTGCAWPMLQPERSWRAAPILACVCCRHEYKETDFAADAACES